jgi:hypothetical protein
MSVVLVGRFVSSSFAVAIVALSSARVSWRVLAALAEGGRG